MCTLNLHLGRQARARGPIANDGEFWFERGIGSLKTPTKGRVSRAPEAAIVRQLLDGAAVAELGTKDGMRTFDQLVPSFRAKELSGPAYDDGCPHTQSQLMHRGRKLAAADRAHAVQACRELIAADQPAGWTSEDVSVEHLQLFTAACTSGTGAPNVLHSLRHTRASRMSRYVTVARAALRTGREITCLAEVLYFLRLRHPAVDDLYLRLAVCKVFREQQRCEGMVVGRLDAVQHERRAVLLDDLGPLLVTAHPPGEGRIFGIRYFNQSRLA